MAIAVNVPGAALIKVNTGSGLGDLGYTVNGARIVENPFFASVHGDQNGGDEGPSVDEQFMGETHDIQLDLSKYDETIADAIRAMVGTAGIPITAGTLMVAGSKYFRLVIVCAALSRNYPICIARQAKEVNKGTKYSLLRITATAYRNLDSPFTLWNTTTS